MLVPLYKAGILLSTTSLSTPSVENVPLCLRLSLNISFLIISEEEYFPNILLCPFLTVIPTVLSRFLSAICLLACSCWLDWLKVFPGQHTSRESQSSHLSQQHSHFPSLKTQQHSHEHEPVLTGSTFDKWLEIWLLINSNCWNYFYLIKL